MLEPTAEQSNGKRKENGKAGDCEQHANGQHDKHT